MPSHSDSSVSLRLDPFRLFSAARSHRRLLVRPHTPSTNFTFLLLSIYAANSSLTRIYQLSLLPLNLRLDPPLNSGNPSNPSLYLRVRVSQVRNGVMARLLSVVVHIPRHQSPESSHFHMPPLTRPGRTLPKFKMVQQMLSPRIYRPHIIQYTTRPLPF